MPSTADYNELLPVISAMNPADALAPNIPIDVFIQEAENLYHWCFDDRDTLTRVGLDWNLALGLPVRAGACAEAQALWMKEFNSRPGAEHAWKEQAPAAFDLHDHLIHGFRYAFRQHPVLLGRVGEIALGLTNAEKIQNLNDLAVLGKANLPLVTAVGITPEELDMAADTSDRMGSLLGAVNAERKGMSEAMQIRDKAYTYLKQAVDEIRNCGKFAFWRTPDRLKGYNSEYWKAQKKSTTEKGETPA